MTIVADAPIRRRPWPGYSDPRWPTGLWVGDVTVTGDASGGLRFARLILVAALQPQGSEIWSVEQMAVTDSDNNSKEVTLQAVGLDRTLSTQTWNVNLAVGPVTAGLRSSNAGMPLFLGGQATLGSTVSLDIFVANVDVVTLQFQAQGYIWGARSRSTPGGPQRPPQGLYPA